MLHPSTAKPKGICIVPKIKPKTTARQERRRLPVAEVQGSPSIGEFTSNAAAEILTTAHGSPSVGEFTIGVPSHATIGSHKPPGKDIAIIRSLAEKRGWSVNELRKMSTGQVMMLLGNDLMKLEGDKYHKRSRSTYRRAQGRPC
jgi:hypothetical protein